MTKLYVVNVQILRFFAAMLVAFAHIGIAVQDQAEAAGQSFRMFYPLDWGLGVDVFFIISGFIMYFLMHGRFQEPGVSAHFFKRRLLRIVPLYWLCTTMMLVSILVAGNLINNNALDIRHIIASYLFFPWPRADGQVGPLLSLGWTLNYEMLFYLAFAAVLPLPRRIALPLLVAAFALLSLAAFLSPPSWWLLRFWGDMIIGEFLLGIGLAAAFLKGIRFSGLTSIILVVVGLVAAVIFYQTGSYNHLTRFITGGIPAILIASGVVLGPHAPLKRPFTWLALGGDASYALYLTHPFTIKALAVVGAKLALPPVAVFALGVIACIAVSIVVHLVFEKPVGNFLQRRLDRRPVGIQRAG